MARSGLLTLLLLIAGCASLPAAPDDALARFAGTWEVTVRDESGAPIPGHTIVARVDSGGWSQRFPERPNIPVRVLEASGDLVVFQAGPYESVLRPGVRVTALYVTRFSGDRSTGHLLAWYEAPGQAIPALRGRTEGRRLR